MRVKFQAIVSWLEVWYYSFSRTNKNNVAWLHLYRLLIVNVKVNKVFVCYCHCLFFFLP